MLFFTTKNWDAWVTESVKHLTVDFGADHALTVYEFEPCVGLSADSVEPAWDSLSLSLTAPPLLVLCLSLSHKINKHLKKSY